jgi:hypothetical protein
VGFFFLEKVGTGKKYPKIPRWKVEIIEKKYYNIPVMEVP